MGGRAEDGTHMRNPAQAGPGFCSYEQKCFPREGVNRDRSFHGANSWGSRWCERSDVNMGSLETESATLIPLADG